MSAREISTRDEVAALTRLALPIVGTGLAEQAINTTDVVMMGWLGTEAVAAGILGAHFFGILHFSVLGVVAAVAPMLAHAIGANTQALVPRILHQGLLLALLFSVPSLLIMWFAKPLLVAIGQDPALVTQTEQYLRARMWGYPAVLGFMALSHFLAAHSRPRMVMAVTIGAIAVNAFGNYALMFGNFGFPALGLVGAGIASSVVEWLSFGALAVFVSTAAVFRHYRVFASRWQFDPKLARELLALGLPIAGAVLAEAGMFLSATIILGWFGPQQLAGHAVAIQCITITFMVPYGIAQAATVRVGLSAGAGRLRAAARAGWVAIGVSFGFMLLPAAALWWLAADLAGLYLDRTAEANAAALGFAIAFMQVAAIFQIVDGTQCVAMGALRGLKDTRTPMFIAVFAYWGLGFSAALYLGVVQDMGGVGVWSGFAFGLTAAAIALPSRLRWLTRRRLAAPGG